MAITKKNEFGVDDQQLAKVAKAMAHPARIAILKILVQQNSCICGDIVELLPLSQSTVSQHLKELKEAGLITGTIDGPRVCYCIDNEAWQKARLMFDTLMVDVNPKCC